MGGARTRGTYHRAREATLTTIRDERNRDVSPTTIGEERFGTIAGTWNGIGAARISKRTLLLPENEDFEHCWSGEAGDHSPAILSSEHPI